MAIEVFADQPSCVASGTSGTTAPASGTSESWTMGTGYTSFPTASASAVPLTQFRIMDPAAPSEVILVTNGGGGSATWSGVTRGAEGTIPVAHATGATYVQVISAGTLQNFKQASDAQTSAVTIANSAAEVIVATYTPVPSEIAAGVTFEAVAFGTFGTGGSTVHTHTWRLRWGGLTGTQLCILASGTNAPAMAAVTTVAAGSSFDVAGTVTLLSATSAVANLNWWYSNSTSLSATASNALSSSSASGLAAAPVAISGGGPLVLTFQWGTANAANSLIASAPAIYREV